MKLVMVTGRAHPGLARAIAGRLGITPAECRIETFPDGEIGVSVPDSLWGGDVYILQPTGPPVERHLLELLLIGDAAKRAGAVRVTAVIPYFGYARQDRRNADGEPIGAKVVADMIGARADRLITVHLHNPAIEGLFTVPVEHLSAARLIADRLRQKPLQDAVIVAPDLGAVKLAQYFADALGLPVAIVHKERLSGNDVRVGHVSGDVDGRHPVVVDDMVSTGGTLVSTLAALRERGCRLPATAAVTHALSVENAAERLAGQPIGSFLATNSLPQQPDRLPGAEVVDISGLIAEKIGRLHRRTPA